MKYLALLVFLPHLLSNYGFADIAIDSELVENRMITDSKIQPILLKWQASENPAEFAKINGLEYKDEKILVYLHLANEEYLSKLPPEINVVASDQKIAVAYVSSSQLDEIENFDYVERVTLPVLAKTPPIPQMEVKDKISIEEKKDNTLILFLMIAITVMVVTPIIILKIKKSENRLDS